MKFELPPVKACRLEEKVAIVTGAGSSGPGLGNGKAISLLFAAHGAKVVLSDVNAAALDETVAQVREIGGECHGLVMDVTRTDQVRQLIDAAVERYGGIDVLVNNVGIVELGNVVDASEESWDRVFATNLRSAFLTMKYAVPRMLARGGGSIVNISTGASIRISGVPYCSYSSSKAALNQLTKCVALDFARQGIRANNILPGLIDTPMPRKQTLAGYADPGKVDEMLRVRAEMSPTGAQGVAWDVAQAALFLASPESSYINGMDLAVDGGLKELIPLPPKHAH